MTFEDYLSEVRELESAGTSPTALPARCAAR